ncbi:MAG: hypothetical protein H0V17_07950 [Deltaproteobacteria bacterium]|nr:hypothetical protein [Deltaproteobacteria bacterium]
MIVGGFDPPVQSTVPVGVFSHMRSVILVGVLVATPAAAGATQLHHGGYESLLAGFDDEQIYGGLLGADPACRRNLFVTSPAFGMLVVSDERPWWLMPLALAGVAIVLARATSSIDA